MINCILAGVGGQGTVLASKLIAQSAMAKGMKVRTSETIGMAQRGGCVVSHVRIGEGIHSPLVPLNAADVIIGFEPAEAVRCLPYLKEGGTVIVNKSAIKPITDSLSKTNYSGDEMVQYLGQNVKKLIVIDGEAIFTECSSAKVLNIALLGAASAAGVLGFSPEDLEVIIREKLHAKFVDLNLKALRIGAETYMKSV
jgi:indolepyruvate ferredoxin oxidoreductase, beta subunit